MLVSIPFQVHQYRHPVSCYKYPSFMLHPLVLIALILDLRCTCPLKANIQEFVRSRDDALSIEIIHILSMLSRDQRAWYSRLPSMLLLYCIR
jgi:hypothetical protein